MQRVFRRLVYLQVVASGVVTVLLFTAYTVVVVTQVYFRYVLNDSLFWAEEFSRLAFFATIMMSLPVVSSRNAHIVMDLLESNIPDRSIYKHLIRTLNQVLIIVFFVLLFYFGLQLAEQGLMMQTSTLGISMKLIYLLMPISATICIQVLVDQIIQIWARQPELEVSNG